MRAVLALIALAPSVGRADAVGDEVSAGTASHGARWIANRLTGVWDVDDRFTIQLDGAVTRSTGTTGAGTLSLAYAATDHWSIAVVGGYVPAAESAATETIDEMTGELRALASSISVAAVVDYDTAGDLDHETSHETRGSLGLGVDHIQSQQTFGGLPPLWSQLSRYAVTAGVVRTEQRDVELGVDATYYLYDGDPTTAGYFRLPGRGPTDLGTGIAIAPLRLTLAPTIANRWGKLRGSLAVSYTALVDDTYELAASLRVQYRLAAVRLHAAVTGAWTVDDELARALSLALGGTYAW